MPGLPVVLSPDAFSQEKAKLSDSVSLTQVTVNTKREDNGQSKLQRVILKFLKAMRSPKGVW